MMLIGLCEMRGLFYFVAQVPRINAQGYLTLRLGKWADTPGRSNFLRLL